LQRCDAEKKFTPSYLHAVEVPASISVTSCVAWCALRTRHERLRDFHPALELEGVREEVDHLRLVAVVELGDVHVEGLLADRAEAILPRVSRKPLVNDESGKVVRGASTSATKRSAQELGAAAAR
jgi:hypothetical protein